MKNVASHVVEQGETFPTTLDAANAAGNGGGFPAFYADHHVVPLPPGHRFPMDKYGIQLITS